MNANNYLKLKHNIENIIVDITGNKNV